MAGVRWWDQDSSEEVARRCGLHEIQFRACEKREGGEMLQMVEEMEIPERRPVGRPRKMWKATVWQDLADLGFEERAGLDRERWKQITTSPTPHVGMAI